MFNRWLEGNGAKAETRREAHGESLSVVQSVEGGVGSDRRRAARYTVSKNEAQFRRTSGEGSETILAELINVSYSGALALVGSRLPANSSIEFRLTRPNLTDWTEVTIVQISLAPGHKFQVRLTFPESCPYEFFQAAVDRF
jgi:hypothetical protein